MVPVHKKGKDIDKVENHRPITLLSCVAKLFTNILNRRLSNWSESNNKLIETQFGFRPDHCTTDGSYLLNMMSQHALQMEQRLFVVFVDLSSAFSTVIHGYLWKKLMDAGVRGKILRIFRDMYSKIRFRVRDMCGTLGTEFEALVGVLQGEPWSPAAFAYYINDVEEALREDGAGLSWDMLLLLILAYADDMTFASLGAASMQSSLDRLQDYCDNWRLKVNPSKTRLMMIGAGPRGSGDILHLSGLPIQEVTSFNYLGTEHNNRGLWSCAKLRAASQGRKALFALDKKMAKWEFTFQEKQELFNKLVTPVLLFGAELWGGGGVDALAIVHRDFVRHELRLRKSTQKCMILLECGILPIEVQAQCKLIGYWSKLVDSSKQSLLVSRIYRPSMRDEVGTWYKEVQQCLSHNGFADIWSDNSVNARSRFLYAFILECKLLHLCQLFQACFDSSKCEIYTLLSLNLGICKPAWNLVHLTGEHAAILSCFRTSNHLLPIEMGRWSGISREDRLCQTCETLGDEYHAVFECQEFVD